MPIYEDKSFKDYVNSLPAATDVSSTDMVSKEKTTGDVVKVDGREIPKTLCDLSDAQIVGNILAVVDIVDKKSVNATGGLSDDAACYTTDFIAVKEGFFFKMKSSSGAAIDLISWRILYVGFYDANKSFISRTYTAQQNPFVFAPPENCKYVRFSLNRETAGVEKQNVYIGYTDLNGSFSFDGGVNFANLRLGLDSILSTKEKGLENEDTFFVKRGENTKELNAVELLSQKAFDISAMFVDGIDVKGNFASAVLTIQDATALKSADGETRTDSAYVTTGFIPCTQGRSIYIGYHYTDGRLLYYVSGAFPLVCFYDKYKRYVGYETHSGDGPFELSIPDGTHYVRLQGWKANVGTDTSNKFLSYEKPKSWVGGYYLEFTKKEPFFAERQKIPYLKFHGNFGELTTAKNAIIASCEMNITGIVEDCFVEIKYQGSSSLGYEKKNYSVKFYEDEQKASSKKFVANSAWDVYGAQNKYVLKANFIDPSHCRNIVSAKIWGDVVRARTTPNTHLNSLPNGGAVDGFPVMVFVNDSYAGIYTFNIPKDKWLFAMDGSTQQAIIAVEEYTDPCKFQNTDGDFSGEKGCDFTIEYNSSTFSTDDVIASFNNLISFVINNSGASFRNGIADYLDVEAAIDYIVFMAAVHGSDNWCRNMLFVTYDGVHWIPSVYDMDSTFGTGPAANSDIYAPNFHTISTVQSWHNLWKRMYESYGAEIYARYNKLRTTSGKNVLADYRVYGALYRFAAGFPKALLDEEQRMYPTIPNSRISNIEQMLTFYTMRSKFNDDVAGAN